MIFDISGTRQINAFHARFYSRITALITSCKRHADTIIHFIHKIAICIIEPHKQFRIGKQNGCRHKIRLFGKPRLTRPVITHNENISGCNCGFHWKNDHIRLLTASVVCGNFPSADIHKLASCICQFKPFIRRRKIGPHPQKLADHNS
ncbi:hypothetical protein A3D11_00310 [Candidatus Peribacteria bacterium RIFCSPHIGHO2_02_FULL_49_16]|nr:MAG: hypothetical protein A2880_02620 [Candidatus Peribacteria bacterium RIFCSPHIGHO2_01_FULL_49_38]OGJ59052.1 MAG: hypothetical protein A3D11_00310 [Candidatus Peribacteria bacterium RIFCSPHIGHO2_02_FULL_49_16]